MAIVSHRYILVGIETDPDRCSGRPELLDKHAAEQVLAHLSTDLARLFPSINQCALTMAGTMFDQTQVLRPGVPVFKALQTLQESGTPGQGFQPRLLSIGAANEKMPLEELQPPGDVPLGILQVLPLLMSGPVNEAEALMEEMEHRFLEQGQLSAHAAKALEVHFKTAVNHARFMTLTDLQAMLRLQLEHFGFLPLWELLDAAMNLPKSTLEVHTDLANRFVWRDAAVHSYFETFDHWARHGGGADKPALNQQLQAAYANWTREYRRYLSMLTAHGVTVIQHLHSMDDAKLEESFLLEESTNVPVPSAASVTEHSAGDLGTVTITVVHKNRQINLYPLQASGINDIHRFIREQNFAGDSAFPGGICYNEKTRQLIPDTLPH